MHNRRPSRLALALKQALLAAAAMLALPALAASPAVVVDTAAIVQVADKKDDAKPKAAAKSAKADKKKDKAAAKKSAKKSDRKAAAKKSAGKKKADDKKTAKKKKDAEDNKPGPLADFGKVDAPEDVVHVANWVSHTRNHQKRAFVILDKKQAQLYVFDPRGKLRSRTPVLLGKAVGDHTVPGIGNKPLSQIKDEEKTTPAGRFLAEVGKNNHGEDVIWIDYESAVSMHRLRKVKAEERRFERMASKEIDDNRISNGCVNVPHNFYNKVLRPTVYKYGAWIYVLPETKTPQQLFGSFDVKDAKVQVAAAGKQGK